MEIQPGGCYAGKNNKKNESNCQVLVVEGEEVRGLHPRPNTNVADCSVRPVDYAFDAGSEREENLSSSSDQQWESTGSGDLQGLNKDDAAK